jgi:hypothetical protein
MIPTSGSVTGPSIAPASGANLPGSGAPSSAVDQLLSSADLAHLLTDLLHAYQQEVSSLLTLWQQADALFVQRFDALLSMGLGSRMIDSSTPSRLFFVADPFSFNAM